MGEKNPPVIFIFIFVSLFKIVRDTLHKAYWDILESELNDDPPEYEHAIKLLEEIREVSYANLTVYCFYQHYFICGT